MSRKNWAYFCPEKGLTSAVASIGKLTDHVLREFEGLRDLDKEYQPPDSRWGSEHGLLSSVLWKTFLSTSHASNGKITKVSLPFSSFNRKYIEVASLKFILIRNPVMGSFN